MMVKLRLCITELHSHCFAFVPNRQKMAPLFPRLRFPSLPYAMAYFLNQANLTWTSTIFAIDFYKRRTSSFKQQFRNRSLSKDFIVSLYIQYIQSHHLNAKLMQQTCNLEIS